MVSVDNMVYCSKNLYAVYVSEADCRYTHSNTYSEPIYGNYPDDPIETLFIPQVAITKGDIKRCIVPHEMHAIYTGFEVFSIKPDERSISWIVFGKRKSDYVSFEFGCGSVSQDLTLAIEVTYTTRFNSKSAFFGPVIDVVQYPSGVAILKPFTITTPSPYWLARRYTDIWFDEVDMYQSVFHKDDRGIWSDVTKVYNTTTSQNLVSFTPTSMCKFQCLESCNSGDETDEESHSSGTSSDESAEASSEETEEKIQEDKHIDQDNKMSITPDLNQNLYQSSKSTTTQPLEFNTIQPSEPNTIQPSKPNTIQPSEPNTIQPSEPNTIESSKPNTIQPSKPNTIQPSKPNTIQSSELNTIQPSEPNTIEPSKPNTIPLSKPNTIQPSKPNTIQPSKPNTIQPSEPNTIETLNSNTTRPSEPTIQTSVEPSTTQPMATVYDQSDNYKTNKIIKAEKFMNRKTRLLIVASGRWKGILQFACLSPRAKKWHLFRKMASQSKKGTFFLLTERTWISAEQNIVAVLDNLSIYGTELMKQYQEGIIIFPNEHQFRESCLDHTVKYRNTDLKCGFVNYYILNKQDCEITKDGQDDLLLSKCTNKPVARISVNLQEIEDNHPGSFNDGMYMDDDDVVDDVHYDDKKRKKNTTSTNTPCITDKLLFDIAKLLSSQEKYYEVGLELDLGIDDIKGIESSITSGSCTMIAFEILTMWYKRQPGDQQAMKAGLCRVLKERGLNHILERLKLQ